MTNHRKIEESEEYRNLGDPQKTAVFQRLRILEAIENELVALTKEIFDSLDKAKQDPISAIKEGAQELIEEMCFCHDRLTDAHGSITETLPTKICLMTATAYSPDFDVEAAFEVKEDGTT